MKCCNWIRPNTRRRWYWHTQSPLLALVFAAIFTTGLHAKAPISTTRTSLVESFTESAAVMSCNAAGGQCSADTTTVSFASSFPPSVAYFAELPGISWIIDTSNYPPRWSCGDWQPAVGWLHILSDIVIWIAYLAIPVALVYFARKRGELPFKKLFWLFSAFIICCGTTHLMEAIIFWWPAYGLAGVIKFVTAVISMATVVALIPAIPQALVLRSPQQLAMEVQLRTRELDIARQHANLVIESSPAGMIMFNQQGNITMVNRAAEAMFGYDRAELLQQPIEMLLPHRFRSEHPKKHNQFFTSPENLGMGNGRATFGLRKDGSEFLVEIGLNPVQTGDNMSVLSAIVDVTERKQSEEKMLNTKEALEKSNADLEQFAYIASHDLQEPLRKISSYCELLKEEQGDRLDEDGNEYLDVAINGAQRLRALVQDLLSFSRITTRGKTLRPTDANACLQAALDDLEMVISESDAQVTCDQLPSVIADDSQLTVLFENLVGNAIKYRGDEAPKIHIGGLEWGDQFQFSVSDNGIGIDPQFSERIFQIFQRLHNRRAYSGTGIGLAICKQIIQRFGGSIWVKSKPGGGSTFYFTIKKSQLRERPHVDTRKLDAACPSHRSTLG